MTVVGRLGLVDGQAVPVVAKRALSVRQALEWAFGAERASVDFDELNDGPPATDTIWRLMQRGLLGCRIDGGGRSLPHDDAEVIASILSIPSLKNSEKQGVVKEGGRATKSSERAVS